MLKEKALEQKLVHMVRGQGGDSIQVCIPGHGGCTGPAGAAARRESGVLELKSPGKAPRPLQLRRMRQLQGPGVPGVCRGQY